MGGAHGTLGMCRVFRAGYRVLTRDLKSYLEIHSDVEINFRLPGMCFCPLLPSLQTLFRLKEEDIVPFKKEDC